MYAIKAIQEAVPTTPNHYLAVVFGPDVLGRLPSQGCDQIRKTALDLVGKFSRFRYQLVYVLKPAFRCILKLVPRTRISNLSHERHDLRRRGFQRAGAFSACSSSTSRLVREQQESSVWSHRIICYSIRQPPYNTCTCLLFQSVND